MRDNSEKNRYIWNEDLGVVDTRTDTFAIEKEGRVLHRASFWAILVARTSMPRRVKDIVAFSRKLTVCAGKHDVEIEKIEITKTYAIVKICVYEDGAAVDFMADIVEVCLTAIRPEHVLTRIRKPTAFEIDQYISGLRDH